MEQMSAKNLCSFPAPDLGEVQSIATSPTNSAAAKAAAEPASIDETAPPVERGLPGEDVGAEPEPEPEPDLEPGTEPELLPYEDPVGVGEGPAPGVVFTEGVPEGPTAEDTDEAVE